MTLESNRTVGPYDPKFFADIEQGSIDSARVVAPVVLGLVPAKSLVDVGCGRGAWLSVFRDLGVPVLRGVDGAYVELDRLLVDRAWFTPADLTQPLHLTDRFDLAICLEVAEHLPATAAATLVESLTRAASVVLFSAAIPGQGGTDHVNEQWPTYWDRLFASRGFVRADVVRSAVLGDPSVKWWYRQNLCVYASEEGLRANPALQAARARAGGEEFAIVRREIFEPYVSTRGLAKQLLRAVRRAVGVRVGR